MTETKIPKADAIPSQRPREKLIFSLFRRVSILIDTVFVDDPRAELLPPLRPILQVLRPKALPSAPVLYALHPLLLRVVLEARPPHAVLRQAAQPFQPKILPSLQRLPEVVRHAAYALAQNRRVVVAQRARHAASQQGRKRVRHDGAAQPEDLVGDRARLDEDLLLLDHVDEERVLVEGESVTDAAGAEEDGVEEVFVHRVAVAEGLACVEEEGDVDSGFGTLLAEVEEERGEVGEGAAEIFLSDDVVTCDHFWELELHFDTLVHACFYVRAGITEAVVGRGLLLTMVRLSKARTVVQIMRTPQKPFPSSEFLNFSTSSSKWDRRPE